MAKDIYNFSAGPAMLPREVMQRAQEEFMSYHGSGLSVAEISHRSQPFQDILHKAEADLRGLLNIPSGYSVLFVHGGASLQFSAVPMNLLRRQAKADYFLTGLWSKKAIKEAERYCDVHVVCSSELDNFTHIPEESTWSFSDDAAYVHYCPNETINGVEFPMIPAVGDVPLVADMSSNILSRPVDVSRFGCIYAGAQKNLSIAGFALVIVREDLLGHVVRNTPTLCNYQIYAETGSSYNTPPTYPIYLAGLVLEWLKDKGGLEAIAEINERKAQTLYNAIDESELFSNPIDKAARSMMNVPFICEDATLEATFLSEAEEAGFANLKGHRLVGGFRASIYNAMPEEGVDALVDFLRDFEKRNG